MSFLFSAWWLWLVAMCASGFWVIRYTARVEDMLINYKAKGEAEEAKKLSRSSKWRRWTGTIATTVFCVLFAVSLCVCVGNIMT